MDTKKINKLLFIVLVGSLLGSIGFSVYATGNIHSVWSWYTLWGMIPFLILASIFYRASSPKIMFLLRSLTVLCAASTYFYFQGPIHPDPKGTPMLFFFPIFQALTMMFAFFVVLPMGKLLQRFFP